MAKHIKFQSPVYSFERTFEDNQEKQMDKMLKLGNDIVKRFRKAEKTGKCSRYYTGFHQTSIYIKVEIINNYIPCTD